MLNAPRLIIWSVIGTGVSSVAVQLVTIREFLTQFHGNEITISLVLFSWLLLTGLGSLLANLFKRPSLGLYSFLTLLMGVWPLLQLLVIRALRERVFIHGVSPGFYPIFAYILATTALYCLLLGFVLPYALSVLKSLRHPFTSGQLYITDNMGDIAGGILFSFFLVYWVTPFKGVAITSGLLILTALLLIRHSRRSLLLIIAILITGLFYGGALDRSFEISSLSGQYGHILRYKESPYGRIIITREGPQMTFWESGSPFYSDANIAKNEEKVHYPLSQLDQVKKVLLVSGGMGEAIQEVLKHGPDQIDYVELDPMMTDLGQELGLIQESPVLRINNTDGRRFLRDSKARYDAIIVDLPDPDTFQINRFYTYEFFALAKKRLLKDGILSFALQYSPNYISEVRLKKLSTIYHTAKAHFRQVMVLPGGEAVFLCRDGILTEDIPDRLRSKSIETAYISGFYGGNVTRERIRHLRDGLTREEKLNTDFLPRVIRYVFQEWFLAHGSSPTPFILVLIGLTFLYVAFMKREEYILFSTGLATMGVEMLIIFTFQVIYGYIYLKVGAVITAFLAGLLPGAVVSDRLGEGSRRHLMVSEFVLTGLLLVFWAWISLVRGEPHQAVFLAYCFVFSFFCGFQFPAATRMIGEEKSPAASCIAADLMGAAVGTLATGTLLIPLRGIQSAIIFLIGVKISSNMIILLSKSKRT